LHHSDKTFIDCSPTISHFVSLNPRWFARLLLEGQVFASPGAAVTSQCVRELRGALGKSRLRDASAAVVTQMKPIPKVNSWSSVTEMRRFFTVSVACRKQKCLC
jgi:hypothetical protein